MAIYRERVAALTAKIETTSGTDSVPTLAANAVQLAAPPTLTVDYLEGGERSDVIFGGMGTVARTAPGGRYGTVTVRMEARGNGSGYSSLRPEVDVFLRMSGFSYTVPGIYNSLDDGFETGTIYCYTGSKLFKLVGCVCSMKLTAVANQRAFWEFSVTGVLAADPTQLALTSPTLNTTIPPNFRNSAVAIGGVGYAQGLKVKQLEVNYAATIVADSAAGATDGLVQYVITNIVPRMDMTIQQMPLSAFDPYAASKADGSATSTTGTATIGSTTNNKVGFNWGTWALEVPKSASDSGLLNWQLTGALVAGSLGTNSREAQIVFS